MNLYPYQSKLVADIYEQWRIYQNVCAVAATGSGKTVVFSHIARELDVPTCAIAHRKELVSQMSLAFARNGVRHRIIAQNSTIRNCVQIHMNALQRSFYDANAPVAVAGVDTLIRMDPNTPWFKTVRLWIMDETHHLLRDNKWGTAVSMFPNARGLGVTATPHRADGFGLGRHAEGVFDALVHAPDMRDIINMGFLTDYRIFAPDSHIDLTNVTISANGDFSPEKLRAAVHKSKIIGDAVESYLKIAPGKLGVTFCVDVESAESTAAAYRQQGIPAECISAQTPDLARDFKLRQFARGDIKQLVNVDLFGEGFDLPAIEVVTMTRPTWSEPLYRQQCGRALRKLNGKTHGIIIDHVGNVMRHGLPDKPQIYTLDRREKTARSSATSVVMTRVCPSCTGVFERMLGTTCPYCAYTIQPAGRSLPEQVEGVLSELSPETLARLRGEIDAPPKFPYGATPEIVGAIKKRHRERMSAVDDLKHTIATWAAGMDDITAAQRLFFLTFGVDVLTAQTLSKNDTVKLIERIENETLFNRAS